MANKLKYSFEEYINNPSGRGSAVMAVGREAIHEDFTRKLTTLESSKGKVTYKSIRSGDGKVYYIDFKIPSDSTDNFFYDTVVEFTLVPSTNDTSIRNYNVRFFSNDPSFVYTYGYAFKTHGLLISGLEKKLPFRALNQKANTRNPDNTVGYSKNIYFAYLIMVRDNLFDKQNLDRLSKVGNLSLIAKDITSFDKHESERKLMDKKSREGLNNKIGPKHSSIVKGKNLVSDSSAPTTTRTSSKSKIISGSQKQTKTTKRTKKV